MNLRCFNLNFSHRPLTQGTIFWENEGQFYPEKDWIDNVDVVLGWWLSVLANLADGAREDVLLFMEGPYELRLEISDSGDVKVVSADGPFRGHIPLTKLVDEVLFACSRVLEEAAGVPEALVEANRFLKAEEIVRGKLENWSRNRSAHG